MLEVSQAEFYVCLKCFEANKGKYLHDKPLVCCCLSSSDSQEVYQSVTQKPTD